MLFRSVLGLRVLGLDVGRLGLLRVCRRALRRVRVVMWRRGGLLLWILLLRLVAALRVRVHILRLAVLRLAVRWLAVGGLPILGRRVVRLSVCLLRILRILGLLGVLDRRRVLVVALVVNLLRILGLRRILRLLVAVRHLGLGLVQCGRLAVYGRAVWRPLDRRHGILLARVLIRAGTGIGEGLAARR